MKILVTGGAGFIGSNIVDAYIKANHEVLIIDNLSTGKKQNLNPKAKFFEIDITNPEVGALIDQEKPDILNHHAAQIDVRKSVDDPQFDLRVNVGGIINLLQSTQTHRFKKVIFASSGGAIYGEQVQTAADENHPLNPLSPYGINKLAGEKFFNYYSHLLGFSFVALRYANVYGPRQNPEGEAGVISIFANKILKGDHPIINGDGKQTRDYVFVGDIVRANLLALKDNVQGVFNVGTGVETDVNYLFAQICTLLDGRFEEKHGPAKLGEQMRSCLNASLLQKTMEFGSFVPMSEGLKKTAEWFVQNHKKNKETSCHTQ